ncbi:hypothetical protein CCAX7_50190 [Capsulimonas corticalis]|uniref:Uncharacterized protein n=1 Tax=Capsulimonas corticalis TaxID=2219043 RepID=A0A402CPL5_9BACT|nr:hypothetical protein [Capsulimonas corticalis]BDI32968.1 hypothetical protein CCAX7_50190 [Capsulimonas corticalis]
MKSKSSILVVSKSPFRRKARQGQTIVIALLVLLLLAFVGGLFVTIVARNLVNAHTAGTVQTADDYAQSGLRFADDQLRTSVEGADWRPPIAIMANLTPAQTAALRKDPDYDYLSQRYARYNTGNGRFLIRVTYDPLGSQFNPKNTQPAVFDPKNPGAPVATDPLARYIKIEAVGREGNIDPKDPTTFPRAARGTQIAKLVAYKPIGITDYARFITDVDRRSDIASIGVPSIYDANLNDITTPGVFDFYGKTSESRSAQIRSFGVATTLGASDAYIAQPDPSTSFTFLLPNPNAGSGASPANGTNIAAGGGAFRSNSSVRFYGKNTIYLNRPDTANTATPSLSDQIEINGDLILDHFDPSVQTGGLSDLTKQPSNLAFAYSSDPAVSSVPVYPSSDPSFQTFGGAVRDGRSGSSGNDANGFARQIKRLDPPKIDNVDSVTSMSRYRSMAINSPIRDGVTNPMPDASQNGYGQTVYINNSSDVQSESIGVTGGGTLVDQWLNRNHANDNPLTSKGGWVGDIYVPPGVEIVFGRLPFAAGTLQGQYGITLIRHDQTANNTIFQWLDPTDKNSGSSVMYIPFRDFYSGVASGNINRDIVIVAEGNVRVHGIISADPNDSPVPTDNDDPLARHITIVTNATAYVEGNLLKGNPNSSIAVLARDYVCVNTTQFTAGPMVSNPVLGVLPPSTNSGDITKLDFTPKDGLLPSLVQEFNFGLPNGGKPSQYQTLALYYSAGPDSSTAGNTDIKFSLYNPRTNLVASFTPGLTNPQDDASAFYKNTMLNPAVHMTVDMSTLQIDSTGKTLLNILEDEPLQLWTSRLNGIQAANNTSQLLLERAAVLPMDIRIEAILYAQNKSFFVIPGQWFNSDGGDTVKNYAVTDARKATPNGFYIDRGTLLDNTLPDQSRYPFNGQPIDMKIIISGAVSEAHPADISAQNAWMQKWGWIPQYHGSMIGGIPSARGEQTIAEERAGIGHVLPNAPYNVSNDHPGDGLTIIYNPQCAFPYTYDTTTHLATVLRCDSYGNPLPFAPRLPVCDGLLYAGQAADDRP